MQLEWKKSLLGGPHRKDRNGTGHDTRALLSGGHLGWNLVQKCQIWFNADFAKFTYLNRSLNLNKLLSLILFFSKVLFLHYLKQMQWWKEPEEPQTKEMVYTDNGCAPRHSIFLLILCTSGVLATADTGKTNIAADMPTDPCTCKKWDQPWDKTWRRCTNGHRHIWDDFRDLMKCPYEVPLGFHLVLW